MKELIPINRLVIARFDIDKNRDQLPKIASLYAQVFAGPPWNEYTSCEQENKYFGLETSPESGCPNCGRPLTLAYPEQDTVSHITKEITKPDAIMFTIKDGVETVAFSWAFSYSNPSEFVIDKYRDSQEKSEIQKLLETNGISGNFFYLSESGINEAYRGRGLSNDFFRLRIAVAREKNLPMVQRTNCNSPMVAVANTFGFKQIMGPEVIVDRVARTITRTGQYVNGIRDKEIEERVLFVLQ